MKKTNANKHQDPTVSKRVTVDLPKKDVDIVDIYCRNSLTPRRKWFYDAMIEKLGRDE
jgi:hypothetical protein